MGLGQAFALGGAVTSMKEAQDTALQTRALDLKSRGLDIQQQGQQQEYDLKTKEGIRLAARDMQTNLDTLISNGMEQIRAGKDPQKVATALGPVVERINSTLQALGNRGGFIPQDNVARFQAQMSSQASPQEKGAAAGTQDVSQVQSIAAGLSAAQPQGAAPVRPMDVAEAKGLVPKQPELNISDVAKSVADMKDKGVPNEFIGATLDAIATSHPNQADGINQIKAMAAGITPQGIGTAQGQQDVAKGKQQVAQLVASGVDNNTANMLVFGRAGVAITLPSDKLTPEELKAAREDVQAVRTARTGLENLLPLVNDKTVGILGVISRGAGGILQQLPGFSTLADSVVGQKLGIDEKTVHQARDLISQWGAISGQVAALVRQRAGRLTLKDREAANEAVQIMSSPSDAKSVTKAINNLIDLSNRLESGSLSELKNKTLDTSAPQETPNVRENKDGSIDLLNPDGSVKFHRPAPGGQ